MKIWVCSLESGISSKNVLSTVRGKHITVSGKYLLHTKCNPGELLKAKE